MDMGFASSNSSADSMPSMNMLFTTGFTQPLYSPAWNPKTRGQYAGTIIFLIVLSILWRGLLAWKAYLEESWAAREKSRTIIVAPSSPSEDSVDDPKKSARVEQMARPQTGSAKPWRWSTDLPRSILTVIASGTGYLLMLAVMTMNVGYFLSILGGIFVGEMMFGRWIGASSAH